MATFQRTLLAFSFVLVVLGTNAADTSCDDACAKPTSWFDYNVFTLKFTMPNSKAYGVWHGQWDNDSKDIKIDAETSDGSVTRVGKILMIAGRVMAVKGDVSEAGNEMDALDAAILQQQVVLRLLGAALPEGTKGLKGSQDIDFSNQKTGIKFATPSAQGFIAPPWHVKGTVNLLAHDVVEYDLTLTSGTRGKPVSEGGMYAQKLSGRLSKSSSAKLDDSMPLESWTLFGVGVSWHSVKVSLRKDLGACNLARHSQ